MHKLDRWIYLVGVYFFECGEDINFCKRKKVLDRINNSILNRVLTCVI